MAHSSGQKAALPWLTLLLACAFAAATGQSMVGSQRLADSSRHELDEAVQFLHQHPYLEVSPALQARWVGEALDSLRKAHAAARRGGGRADVVGTELRDRQHELDAQVARALGPLDELPARRFGVNPTRWRLDTLFTYAAVHSNLLHLGGCLALLLVLGAYLEPALGATRLAGVVTLATLGAAAGFVVTQPELDRVLIGSSGMLTGLLCVFLVEFASSSERSSYSLIVFSGLAWLLAPVALGKEFSFEHPGAQLSGLAIPELALAWVYLGGTAGGMAAYGLMHGFGARPPVPRVARHAVKISATRAELDAVLALRAEGRDEAALKRLLVLVQREPDSIEATRLLVDVASSLGQTSLAARTRLRVVRLESKLGDGLGAVRPWLDLTQREIPAGVEPALLIRMAGLLRQFDQAHAATTALRTALARAEGSSAMVVAGRVARAAKEIDPAIAYDAAWTALGFIELPFAERQEFEALLAQVIPRLEQAEAEMASVWVGDRDRPAPIPIEAGLQSLDVVQAVPIDIDDEGLHVATQGGLKKRIRFERIGAVGVGDVKGSDGRPLLVVDFVLNWGAPAHETLRVVRLRGDRFDPRKLIAAKTQLDAFRIMMTNVLERAEAVPLPDRDAALGHPFRSYDDLDSYAAQVLGAEEPLSENPS